MAGTLTVTLNASLTNGALKSVTYQPGQLSIVQTNIGMHRPIINVGTTEEVISFGDVATEGFVFFTNLDAANFVTIGPESGGAMVPIIKLKPGEPAMLRLVPGVTLRAQADTAAVLLEMWLLED